MASNLNVSNTDIRTPLNSAQPRTLFSSRGKDAKVTIRAKQNSSEGEMTYYLYQRCGKKVEEGINCIGCKLLFCLRCANISKALHKCLINSEMDRFHWNCRCCSSSFPSPECYRKFRQHTRDE